MRIAIAGSSGLIGSALVAALEARGNGLLLDRARFDESGRGDAALEELSDHPVGRLDLPQDGLSCRSRQD